MEATGETGEGRTAFLEGEHKMKGEAHGPVLPPDSCQVALTSHGGTTNGSGGSISHHAQGSVPGKPNQLPPCWVSLHPCPTGAEVPTCQHQLARQPVPEPRAPGLWFVALEKPRSLAEAGPLRHPPVYSGKQMVKGDFLIFSPKRSFLLRKRMMEVSMKNLLLQMESKSMRDSCMRFCSPRRGKERQTDSGRDRHGDREREEEN